MLKCHALGLPINEVISPWQGYLSSRVSMLAPKKLQNGGKMPLDQPATEDLLRLISAIQDGQSASPSRQVQIVYNGS